MKDKWLSGKFDPAVLESTLNSYAKQGWRVVQSVTANVPGILNGNREELVVILERDLEVATARPTPSQAQKTPNADLNPDVYHL